MIEGDAPVVIGKIIKPVGLKGELKVFPLTDFPERFEMLEAVTIETTEGASARYPIASFRYSSSLVYLRFSGLNSIEEVAFLRGGTIQISESERVSLPEAHYFQSDLLGLSVYLQGGALLGRVESIMETGENDLFVVQGDQKEYLIPAIKKVVKRIDLEQKRMVIEPMEGLLEI